MTFESEGLLIVAIYIWLPPASYVVFSDNSGMVLSISQRSICSSHFDFVNRDRTIICIFINFGQHTYHEEIRNLVHFEDQKSMSHWTNIEITIQVHQSWLTYFSCREDESC